MDSRGYEIGGADKVRYRDLVDEVAGQLGRPKTQLTVPVPQPPLGVSQLPDAPARLIPELRHAVAQALAAP